MQIAASNPNPYRSTAVIAGIIFLITEVTAIGGLLLYTPVLAGAEYIVGAGADTRVLLGAFFELLLAAANIGTAVVLFPVIRKQSEAIALGYVGGRILEAAMILVGTLCLVTVVSLRQMVAGTPGADVITLSGIGTSLVTLRDWTFLFGPNFILGCNSFMLAYLLHRAGLVPKAITIIGMVSGPMVILSGIGVMFGLHEQLSPTGGILGLPSLVWEVAVALWMIIKGFKPSAPIMSGFASAQLAPAAA
ncbi:MAG: DUF4386 domain-containing protein [Devosia sp.]